MSFRKGRSGFMDRHESELENLAKKISDAMIVKLYEQIKSNTIFNLFCAVLKFNYTMQKIKESQKEAT